jgi:hypothetical protein
MSKSATTSQETIAENEEREKYADNTVVDTTTNKTFAVDKKAIFGAIILFGGLLVILHFLE